MVGLDRTAIVDAIASTARLLLLALLLYAHARRGLRPRRRFPELLEHRVDVLERGVDLVSELRHRQRRSMVNSAGGGRGHAHDAGAGGAGGARTLPPVSTTLPEWKMSSTIFGCTMR